MNAATLQRMRAPELMQVMLSGHAIDGDAIADTEYRGVSLGLPGPIVKITWKTFKKVFYRDPVTGTLRGWNVRIDQRDPDAYRPMLRRGRPRTFGHFHVVAAAGRRMPKPCDRGLLLDYGLGKHGRLEPTAALRDPIVSVNQGDVDLLLGWSYVELGGRQVSTPSFFTLERDRAISYVAA